MAASPVKRREGVRKKNKELALAQPVVLQRGRELILRHGIAITHGSLAVR
jgi:hypothetical protein